MKKNISIFIITLITITFFDVRVFTKEVYAEEKNEVNVKSLFKAIENNDVYSVKQLILKGVELNISDIYEQTPLMSASKKGYKEIAELFISKGSDVNAKNSFGYTALMFASYNGHKEVAELLISKGADVNAKDSSQNSALDIASRKGYKEIAELLIKAGAVYGLFNLAQLGDVERMKVLIEKIPDVNVKDKDGKTALIYATENGNKEIVDLLNQKIENNSLKEKLFNAIENKNLNMLKDLVSHLSKEKKPNFFNEIYLDMTALMFASYNGNKEAVELLVIEGAKINNKAEDGSNALILASRKGYKEIVGLLISKGADINTKDIYGYTALMRASNNGYNEIVELLKKSGAKE